MAKQKKNHLKSQAVSLADLSLPQNIYQMGEADQADKKVYILQNTYRDVHSFTKDKVTNESGGILVGKEIVEFGKSNILIVGFIEAKHCEATPTTLKFTHKSWEYIHAELEKRYPDGKIVGWIHTHPDFGIFLSEYDKFIQENFFAAEDQVAYVIDPIQNIEGFYIWINGKIEKCAGFFVFDEIGKKIDVQQAVDENASKVAEANAKNGSLLQLGLSVLAAIAIIALGLMCFKLNSNIVALQSQIKVLAQQNQFLQQEVISISSELEMLHSTVMSEDTDTEIAENTAADDSSNDEDAEKSKAPLVEMPND